MKKFLLFTFIAFFTVSNLTAQPERELRAVWLTSVYNIDWPHSVTATPESQQQRLITILDDLHAANFNAVMFQVRPNADALYQSAFEPWSNWITGVRGQVPAYDPLAFVIQEANKRGMEVHAWLNPYRYEITAGQFSGLPGDYSKTHPELIITYPTTKPRTYFDPGNPATTQLIKKIVADLITNYDIDGVIFDDYFYPSGLPTSYDQKSFDTWGTKEFVSQWYNVTGTLPSRGDFRRASVNNMIREVNDTIKSLRPSMVFGVSPAGIYSTQASAATHWGTTLPPGISGGDNYNSIYCDPLAWLRDQSVDYISPQLYWKIGGAQDFITLTQWWGNEAKRRGRHHYPSLAPYKMFPQTPPLAEGEWPLTEMEDQITANRANPNNLAQGLIFYNTKSTINTSKSLAAYLAADLFSEKRIFPELAWLPSVQEGSPRINEMGIVGEMTGGTAGISISGSPVDRFLLYGWEGAPGKSDKAGPDFMQVIFGKNFSEFYHQDLQYFSVQEYMPNRELGFSSPDFPWEHLVPAHIVTPANQSVCDGFVFAWEEVPSSEAYQVQVALQQQPGTTVFTSPLLNTNTFVFPESTLTGQENYVYRVKAIAGQSVSWSSLSSFTTGQPATTKINSPLNNAQNTKLTTTLQWSNASAATSYHVQVATDPSFASETLVVDQQPVNLNIYAATLQKYNTQHYVRVRGINSCGYGAWSPVVTFTTLMGTGVELTENYILKTFPNPVSSFCRIDYPETTGARTVTLTDVKGRIIYMNEKADQVDSEEIDLSQLTPGVYFLKIETVRGHRYRTKIIKSN